MVKNKSTSVKIMGEELSENQNMKSAGDMIWGTLLLYVGAMLLLNFFDIVSWTFWDEIWRFWPVLLILSGLSIILGDNWFSRQITLIFSIIFFGLVCLIGLNEIGHPGIQSLPPLISTLIETWEEISP